MKVRKMQVAESVPLAQVTEDGAGRSTYRARLIEGDRWGSSGYYSNEVLEAAAANKVFAAGTQMYLDHPGQAESFDRPSRSVRDLAGKLATDAVFESDGLYADIEVYPHVAPIIEAMAADIGLSIRAYAETEQGEAEGQRGTIVREFDQAISVDFVTRAGAGGLLLVESARANRRAIGHGISEATVNDTREALRGLLVDAYGADKTYVWVRDFDETTVWFEVESDTDQGMYGQAYSTDDTGAVALADDRTEVRVVTTYVPVNPAGQSTPSQESSKEINMGTIQVDEAEHRRLTTEAGRVQALESERDAATDRATTAETERDQLREEKATADRAAVVARIVGESVEAGSVTLSDLERDGLTGRAVMKEDGTVDETATRTAFDKVVAGIAESRGAGRPRGFGFTDKSDEDISQEAADEARRRRAGLASVKEA